MVFKTLDIRQRRAVIPEISKHMSPSTAQASCLKFPGYGAESGYPAEPSSLPMLKRRSWEARTARVCRTEYQRRRSYTESKLWSSAEGPQKSEQVSMRKTACGWGRNPPKASQG